MSYICRRCKRFDFVLGCMDGCNKTETQIKADNYDCFKERILKINKDAKCTDEFCNVYGNETDARETRIHIGLIKARRKQVEQIT